MNEYRLQTSWIRNLRRVFPYLVTGLLMTWVFYLAPILVQGMMTEFQGFIASQVALVVFELILFTFSVFLVLVPVSNTLKDEGINQVELMLKSPVRPGDVLVGEFIGKTPIYAIIATFTIGLFTALLAPLGLSLLQTILIIFMAFVAFLSSFWVGTVIAGVARTTIGRTAKGKDLGKALSFILALPLVAVFYSLINGDLFNMLLNPGTDGLVKAVLGLFPSSWAAEVIVAFANNPGNIAAVLGLAVTRVGGMMVFIVGALWVGWMVTDRTFSLEPTNLGVTRVGPDGILYKTVRLLGGGGAFGSLLVSAFKDYSRRLENLTQLGYVVGLLVLMQAFFIDDSGGSQIMGLLMGTVIALFMSSEATIRGKETLFARARAAKLVQAWLLVLPLLARAVLG